MTKLYDLVGRIEALVRSEPVLVTSLAAAALDAYAQGVSVRTAVIAALALFLRSRVSPA